METLINELVRLKTQLEQTSREIAGMRPSQQTPRIKNLIEQANEYRNYLEEEIAQIENNIGDVPMIVGVIINLN